MVTCGVYNFFFLGKMTGAAENILLLIERKGRVVVKDKVFRGWGFIEKNMKDREVKELNFSNPSWQDNFFLKLDVPKSTMGKCQIGHMEVVFL